MLDFFLLVFGGVASLFAAINDKAEKKEAQDRNDYLHILFEKHGAKPSLVTSIRTYVNKHYLDLLEEFNDDLVYIFGSYYVDLEKKAYSAGEYSSEYIHQSHMQKNAFKYSIKECVRYLVLAKHYQKLENFLLSYTISYSYHVGCSLRMFKTINKYISEPDCQITFAPYFGAGGEKWGIFSGEFLPACRNLRAEDPRAKIDYWLSNY